MPTPISRLFYNAGTRYSQNPAENETDDAGAYCALSDKVASRWLCQALVAVRKTLWNITRQRHPVPRQACILGT